MYHYGLSSHLLFIKQSVFATIYVSPFAPPALKLADTCTIVYALKANCSHLDPYTWGDLAQEPLLRNGHSVVLLPEAGC